MKQRTFIAFFYIVFILLAAAVLSAPVLIVRAARASIQDALPGCRVAIAACRLWPPAACTFSGIEIQRPGMYRISVPSITVRPGISGTVRIPDFQIEAHTAGGSSQARAALFLARWGKQITGITLTVPRLHAGGINIVNGVLEASSGSAGRFNIEKLSAGKLIISGITADASLENNSIGLTDLSALLFGGSVTGSAYVSVPAGMAYQASIRVSRMDMAAVISDLDLTERLEVSGALEGAAGIEGSAAGYTNLWADLAARAPGGVLNIRDQRVIDMIAQSSGQARDLISRSFTDYRYDRAQAQVHTEGNKLVLDVEFEGEGGKRTLRAVLHDFTVQGGGT